MSDTSQPRHSRNDDNNDLLRIMQRRRAAASARNTADSAPQPPTPKRRDTAHTTLTKAQQRRNTIIAMAVIPAALLGVGTAAASTIYNDLAVPMMTTQGSCEKALQRVETQREKTQQLLLGTDVDTARERAGLADGDTLDPAHISPDVWVRLGDASPAVQTLLTATLLIDQPAQLPEGAQRSGVHDITDVIARPDTDTQPFADTAVTTGETQYHLDPVNYAAYIHQFPRANDAVNDLAQTVIATINGDNDELFTTPACTTDNDVRTVVHQAGKLAQLRNGAQDNIDAIAARLRFAEIDSWCANTDNAQRTRELADDVIRRAEQLRGRIDGAHTQTNTLQQHSSDLEQIIENVQQQKAQITDPPICRDTDVPATDIETQHTVIADYHDSLDELFNQIMHASVAVHRHTDEVNGELTATDTARREHKAARHTTASSTRTTTTTRSSTSSTPSPSSSPQTTPTRTSALDAATQSIADALDAQRRGEPVPAPQEVTPEESSDHAERDEYITGDTAFSDDDVAE